MAAKTVTQETAATALTGAELVRIVQSGASAKTTIAGLTEMLTQPSSSLFYQEDGAKIQRLNSRVFAGGATKNNATNVGSQPDWMTTYLISKGRTFGFQHVATMAVLSENNTAGQNAFVAGAQTVDLTSVGNAVGVLGVGVNNNATHATGAWGGYFEGFQNASQAGPAYAAEFDTINFGSSAYITPFDQASNQVIAVQIANGAEFTGANAAHAAINIRNNGARYNTGIVFGATSLTGTDGTGSGSALAMVLARGHGFKWMASDSINTTEILSTAATTANSASLVFGESATFFNNASSGKALFGIYNIGATAVNYLAMQASATGNATQMLAAGDDANIDIQWIPKGTGVMSFGAWTSNADAAVNGYIAIKDAAGNMRKLATIA